MRLNALILTVTAYAYKINSSIMIFFILFQMRYEELQSLCVEIHSGKCDQSRNYEIQRYLNQWSNNG